MEPQQIFRITNALALAGWLVLILPPQWKWTDKFVKGVIILLLCLVYAWLVASMFRMEDLKSFGSLQGVQELFQHPAVLVAGWVHYLAFDLFVGCSIRNDAARNTISHWMVIPCLLLTFLLGPLGLLLYWTLRFFKKVFANPKTMEP